MKKHLTVFAALLLTAALVFLARKLLIQPNPAPSPGISVVRVWIQEKDPAVSAWLRSLASGYEKATGQRVYLRLATPAEAAAAQAEDGAVIPPDVLIAPGKEAVIALRGFALILRDDTITAATPLPTSALFFRPSPSPGPTLTPGPTPDPASLGAVLAPEALSGALPGAVRCDDPAAGLIQGKANAALLTAGQAGKLPFGYRAYPLPRGAGMMPVSGMTFTPAGEGFLNYLRQSVPQQALAKFGLYSPFLRLYGPDDPLRFLIESSFVPEENSR